MIGINIKPNIVHYFQHHEERIDKMAKSTKYFVPSFLVCTMARTHSNIVVVAVDCFAVLVVLFVDARQPVPRPCHLLICATTRFLVQ